MNARFRNLRWLLAVVAVIAVIAIILVVVLLRQLLTPSEPPQGGAPGSSSSAPARPSTQPADCPDVLTLVIPGTWESAPGDDPIHPRSNPRSLLLRVSSALQNTYSSDRTTVYTVPYLAQFRNPTNLTDRQADYNTSRTQGYKRAAGKIIATHKHCPITRYVIMGFSQGAVIGGDLASAIGNGRGVLPAADQDLVLGVGLIADGRRKDDGQRNVGPNPPGVGAEISLSGMGTLVPGMSMTGPRTGGFGTLADRVVSICAPGDLICDAPTVTNPIGAVNQLSRALSNPVHALYATTRYWSIGDGVTSTQWLFGWARGIIADAPHV
ncbi:MAG: cutinase family protein [Gordonia sp. (in: high G+C Gram-positive bacteria)]